jgi:hypothetical protein
MALVSSSRGLVALICGSERRLEGRRLRPATQMNTEKKIPNTIRVVDCDSPHRAWQQQFLSPALLPLRRAACSILILT